jgi:serine/threonine protein kinase
MELVDATTLDQKLPRSHIQAVDIFLQIAEGLSHMHGRGFVHADMKPNNVLVDDSGKVKIIDLGQACAIGTIKKRIQGTPGYMAPEQAHRGEITAKTNKKLVNVFVPTTPNPTSGFLLMFPKDEVIYLDLTFEEASKFIVSAGTSEPS